MKSSLAWSQQPLEIGSAAGSGRSVNFLKKKHCQ